MITQILPAQSVLGLLFLQVKFLVLLFTLNDEKREKSSNTGFTQQDNYGDFWLNFAHPTVFRIIRLL